MRRLMMCFAVLLLAALPARAQDTYPTAEIFGGYSYFSADIEFDDPFDDDDQGFFDEREGIHGFGFSVTGNFHPNIGIVGDFSYHKREIEIPFGNDIDISNFVFLFGPRFTARGDAVDFFGHAMVGGVRNKVENFDSDTELALGFGGGLDIKVTDSFAVRAFQLDYIPMRSRNIFTGDKEWIHNGRFQIGLTYKWNAE
ncbi:MAG TPA: outer membrane beta-barrel protein [Blastocatellia bacterium]|nr:outer membrane beta-barrel protein [Blastocatellia bacterium]